LDVILEITKYLLLEDAITAFSTNILPLLHKYKTRVHLSEPSKPFTKMILRKLDPEQIVSLQVNTNHSKLDTLDVFNRIIALTFLGLQHIDRIKDCQAHFLNLICVSFWYDTEVDFYSLSNIFYQLSKTIKRVAIRCAGSFCTHYFSYKTNMEYLENTTIEYFLIDVSHIPLRSMNNCFHHHSSCFLMMAMSTIKNLINIRHICFVANKYNIEELLDLEQWTNLVIMCRQLKKVTLKVLRTALRNERLIQKVSAIQKELYNVRQTIKFQIIFS
jgi:hypothetical protein